MEVLTPSLPAFGSRAEGDLASTSLEDYALQAAESGVREVGDICIGETAFLLVVVRGHDASALWQAVNRLGNPCVSALPLESATDQPTNTRASTTPAAPAPSRLSSTAGDVHAEEPATSDCTVSQAPVSRNTPLNSVLSAESTSSPNAIALAGVATGANSTPPSISQGGSNTLPIPTSAGTPIGIPSKTGISAGATSVSNPFVSPRGTDEPRGHGEWNRTQPHRGLPVLQESAWVSVTDPVPGEPMGTPGVVATATQTPQKVLCKGVWVLVSVTTENANPGALHAITGRQTLLVTMQENSRMKSVATCEVESALELANRQAGPSGAFAAAKVVNVHMPIEMSTRYSVSPSDDSRAYVTVNVRNVTSNYALSVLPPTVELAHSTVVDADGHKSISARTSDADTPSGRVRARTARTYGREPTGRHVSLENHFVFRIQESEAGAPEAVLSETQEINAATETHSSERTEQFRASDEDGPKQLPDSRPDEDRLVGASTSTPAEAVALGPLETYQFVFAVESKGSTQSLPIGDTPMSTNSMSLAHGECFETQFLMCWSCRSRDDIGHDLSMHKFSSGDTDSAQSSNKELSLRNGSIASQTVAVMWAPPSVLQDVVISFSGPPVVARLANLDITITLFNRTRHRLLAATLFINSNAAELKEMVKASGAPNSLLANLNGPSHCETKERMGGGIDSPGLLPLRTVISAGRIGPDESATIRVPCLAIGDGIASVGDVSVVDMAPAPGVIPRIWTASCVFETFVVDNKAPIPGDPMPSPAITRADEYTLGEGLATIEL